MLSKCLKCAHCASFHVLSIIFSFFQDGLKTADKLKQYIEKLAADLYNVCKLHFNWELFSIKLWKVFPRMTVCVYICIHTTFKTPSA